MSITKRKSAPEKIEEKRKENKKTRKKKEPHSKRETSAQVTIERTKQSKNAHEIVFNMNFILN
jgi:hypothetical protein